MRGFQRGVLFLLSFLFLTVAISSPAQAGLWDNIRIGTVPLPIQGINLNAGPAEIASTSCAGADDNAPQELLGEVCSRIVACMPGEDARALRIQCLLRLTGEEGKTLWKALLATNQDDPPTVTTLSNWLRTEKAQVNVPKYCACSAALPSLSCEAIQSRFNATNFSWVGEAIEGNAACEDVFSGPIGKADFEAKGGIHVFARCLDEQNQGKVCHWMAPPGGNLWGNNYWFHQLQMRADHPISVDYHKPSKTLNMVAYVKATFDEGSIHAMHCDADRFDQRAYFCGADNEYFKNRLYYNPIIVTSPRADARKPEESDSGIYFNTGNDPHPLVKVDQGLVSIGWISRPGNPEGDELRVGTYSARGGDVTDAHDYGDNCDQGMIALSPTKITVEDPNPVNAPYDHLFGVAGDNNILHVFGYSLNDRCEIHKAGADLSHMFSSPKAIFGTGGKIELYALGENYRPYRWEISTDNQSITSERLVDVQASMAVENWLGVAVTPNDQKTHVFFRRHGAGTVVHAFKSSNNPAWSVLYPSGIDGTAVLDSPAAVTDAEGNLHLFAGEWGGPNYEKAGSGRAYLHHFVKAAGASNWQSETLLLGNVQHTDQGHSAATAIFIGPEGETTERNRIVGAGRVTTPTTGSADPTHCKGGALYNASACPDPRYRVGATTSDGLTVQESFSCIHPFSMTTEEAIAQGRCPAGSRYTETSPISFECTGFTGEELPCPSGYGRIGLPSIGGYLCYQQGPAVEAEWGTYYSPELCAAGFSNPVSLGIKQASSYTSCCVKAQ